MFNPTERFYFYFYASMQYMYCTLIMNFFFFFYNFYKISNEIFLPSIDQHNTVHISSNISVYFSKIIWFNCLLLIFFSSYFGKFSSNCYFHFQLVNVYLPGWFSCGLIVNVWKPHTKQIKETANTLVLHVCLNILRVHAIFLFSNMVHFLYILLPI